MRKKERDREIERERERESLYFHSHMFIRVIRVIRAIIDDLWFEED